MYDREVDVVTLQLDLKMVEREPKVNEGFVPKFAKAIIVNLCL